MNKKLYQNYTEVLGYKNTTKEFTLFRNYFAKNYAIHLPQDKDAYILDVGCGNGLFLRFLKSLGYTNIFGIDLSNENVSFCNEIWLNVVLADVQEFLSDKDNYYDVIIMNDIVEHFPKQDLLRILEQSRLSLKDRGNVFIKTMNMSNPIAVNTLFCDFTHHWGYTEKSIKQVASLTWFSNCHVYDLYIYPNLVVLDQIIYLIYKVLRCLYKIRYTFYWKSSYKIFTKNFLAVFAK